MQVAVRRLIIVSAIAFGGAAAGLALGNFVAGAPSRTGIEELAAYNSMFLSSDADAPLEDPKADFARRPGPTDYQCQGCDAHLYHDMMPAATSAADTAPLPPYEVYDPPMPAPSPTVAVTRPPVVRPPSQPSAYSASVVAPPVADRPGAVAAAPALPAN